MVNFSKHMTDIHSASVTVWGSEYKVLIQKTGLASVAVVTEVYDDIPNKLIASGGIYPVEIEKVETHYHFDRTGKLIGINKVTGDGYMVSCTVVYENKDSSISLITTFNDRTEPQEKVIDRSELDYETELTCASAALTTAKNQNSFKLWQRDGAPLQR